MPAVMLDIIMGIAAVALVLMAATLFLTLLVMALTDRAELERRGAKSLSTLGPSACTTLRSRLGRDPDRGV